MNQEAHYPNSPCNGVFTLVEAAAMMNCSIQRLLIAAIEGKLRCLIGVPKTVSILDIDNNTLKLEHEIYSSNHIVRLELYKKLIGNGPINMTNQIDYLVLSKIDCKKLIDHQAATQSLFTEGFQARNEKEIFIVPKSYTSSTKQVTQGRRESERQFASYDTNEARLLPNDRFAKAPRPIAFTIDAIRISQGDFFIYQRKKLRKPASRKLSPNPTSKSESEQSNDLTQRQVTEFHPKPFHSENLIQLVEAYRLFWLRIYSRFEFYPKSSPDCNVVMRHFVEKFGYPKSMAIRAANMIRPEYARGIPDVEVQYECFDYFPSHLWALLQASEHFSKVERGKMPGLEVENEMNSWLSDNYHFPRTTAKAGTRIVVGCAVMQQSARDRHDEQLL
jgi:hypothetical protein